MTVDEALEELRWANMPVIRHAIEAEIHRLRRELEKRERLLDKWADNRPAIVLAYDRGDPNRINLVNLLDETEDIICGEDQP